MTLDSFQTKSKLTIGGEEFTYFSLPKLAQSLGVNLEALPYSYKILLENLLRREDGRAVKKADIEFLCQFDPKKMASKEIQYTPARVLLQDFTGVPVVVDLSSFRDAVLERGGDWKKVNPLQQVDLVIDHSVQVDSFGQKDSLAKNARLEFERNNERYEFLKWGQSSFKNFRVIPPATGICHQVNLEFLSQVAYVREEEGEKRILPDTVIGTDSHTPMVNALGIVAWGVGGIEAEAAMLGQPLSLLIPAVIGFELKGKLPVGVTATDLVLTVTQILRKKGVVGKFVEFFGDGVSSLSIADRATIGNMSPEYGATIGIFPPDSQTLSYLKASNRAQAAERTEAYYRAQGMWGGERLSSAQYEDVVHLDLSSVEPSVAGPSKPHERLSLKQAPSSLAKLAAGKETQVVQVTPEYSLRTGDIVIAAITSCTNTSNPDLMIASALVAKRAFEKGLKVPPWVKTSFAPGSKVVPEYLKSAGLMESMEKVGFDLVGFGCTTCIGNSGPLPAEIGKAIDDGQMVVTSVLSGNRNFEARIHPQVAGNYLMSPPLVVAYAFAGNILKDLTVEPIGKGSDGKDVFLKDIWPSTEEIHQLTAQHVTTKMYKEIYDHILDGDENWNAIPTTNSPAYAWKENSTYIHKPPFLDERLKTEALISEVKGARVLAILGDFVTTDHISPAGSIKPTSPAGVYLKSLGVEPIDFNSYGSRRGNDEVMVRGTFANIRLKNKMASKEGGWTVLKPENIETSIYEAAMAYEKKKTPVVIFAGKEYGSGSSRDWAAKGTRLLGVRAVIAESFERIHRSNLVGMGVLPLQLPAGTTVDSLNLTGDEEVDLPGLDTMKPQSMLRVTLRGGGQDRVLDLQSRIDTDNELDYFRAGGILLYVLNQLR